MDTTEACALARRHFLDEADWPRHVANETALEYERLRRLQQQDPAIGPLPGSLLAQFAHAAGGAGALSGRAADVVAQQYRSQFGHSPPYPWHATSPAIENTTPAVN